jgi:hypothetical protein
LASLVLAIEGVKFELPANKRTIRLRDRNITDLFLNTTADYTKVRVVILTRNQLQMPDLVVLDRLSNLKKLIVARNEISGVFDLALLVNLSHLGKFCAFHNRITGLENTKGKGRKSRLKLLNLAKNDISYFDAKVFRGFHRLSSLLLNHNKIYKIDGSKRMKIFMPKLSLLTLHSNPLLCRYAKRVARSVQRSFPVERKCQIRDMTLQNGHCCYKSIHSVHRGDDQDHLPAGDNPIVEEAPNNGSQNADFGGLIMAIHQQMEAHRQREAEFLSSVNSFWSEYNETMDKYQKSPRLG